MITPEQREYAANHMGRTYLSAATMRKNSTIDDAKAKGARRDPVPAQRRERHVVCATGAALQHQGVCALAAAVSPESHIAQSQNFISQFGEEARVAMRDSWQCCHHTQPGCRQGHCRS